MADLTLLYYLLCIFLLALLIYEYLFQSKAEINPKFKTIFITGCDSGVGFALAKHFHRNGCVVISTVLSKQNPGAIQLQQELDSSRFHLVELDYTKDYEKSFAEIDRILDKNCLELYALINNAGLIVMGMFDFYTPAQIDKQITVNFTGLVASCKHFLPRLIRNKGRIVNLSSTNVHNYFTGTSVYTATKCAVEAFSSILRMEMKNFGVQVVIIRLGDFAKVTNIINGQPKIAKEQYELFDEKKKTLYGNFFHQYHEAVARNKGYFSAKDFESTSFFEDFDRAVFAVRSPRTLFITTTSFRIFTFVLQLFPATLRESLIMYLESKILKK